MEINRRDDSYRRASDELARRLIILYGEKIFPRQGKVFADMLFETGVEAGSYVAVLGEIDEKNTKIDLATKALVKLTQTDYLLSVMHRGKYYDASQVEELQLFLNSLINSIRDLLNAIHGPNAARFYTQMRPVAPVPTAPQTQPTADHSQPSPAPVPTPVSAPKQAPAPGVMPASNQIHTPGPAVNPTGAPSANPAVNPTVTPSANPEGKNGKKKD